MLAFSEQQKIKIAKSTTRLPHQTIGVRVVYGHTARPFSPPLPPESMQDGGGVLTTSWPSTGLPRWQYPMSCLIAATPLVPGAMTMAIGLQFPDAQNVQMQAFHLSVQSSSLLLSQK